MFVPMTYCMTSAPNRGTTPYFVAASSPKRSAAIPGWAAPSSRPSASSAARRFPGRAQAIPDIQVHALPWSYPFPNQDSPERQKVDQRPALTIMPR